MPPKPVNSASKISWRSPRFGARCRHSTLAGVLPVPPRWSGVLGGPGGVRKGRGETSGESRGFGAGSPVVPPLQACNARSRCPACLRPQGAPAVGFTIGDRSDADPGEGRAGKVSGHGSVAVGPPGCFGLRRPRGRHAFVTAFPALALRRSVIPPA